MTLKEISNRIIELDDNGSDTVYVKTYRVFKRGKGRPLKVKLFLRDGVVFILRNTSRYGFPLPIEEAQQWEGLCLWEEEKPNLMVLISTIIETLSKSGLWSVWMESLRIIKDDLDKVLDMSNLQYDKFFHDKGYEHPFPYQALHALEKHGIMKINFSRPYKTTALSVISNGLMSGGNLHYQWTTDRINTVEVTESPDARRGYYRTYTMKRRNGKVYFLIDRDSIICIQ